MPFSPGTKIGPYEFLTAIGACGMGEAYLAKLAFPKIFSLLSIIE
jgi:hypothetical protein